MQLRVTPTCTKTQSISSRRRLIVYSQTSKRVSGYPQVPATESRAATSIMRNRSHQSSELTLPPAVTPPHLFGAPLRNVPGAPPIPGGWTACRVFQAPCTLAAFHMRCTLCARSSSELPQ